MRGSLAFLIAGCLVSGLAGHRVGGCGQVFGGVFLGASILSGSLGGSGLGGSFGGIVVKLGLEDVEHIDRKSTRLNSSHL